MAERFTAMVLDEKDGKPVAEFRELGLADLPDLDVLVKVSASTVNYKDGLAVGCKQKIARKPPLVGGIDLAGTVVEDRSGRFQPGDKVHVNGWGMSETQWGGYTPYQRVKAEWITRTPDAFTAADAMAIGTAGYTAALCVDALEDWGSIKPGVGEVLVTGAAGGVGSIAIALLAKRGYNVTAATGRPETHDYLRGLGASNFIAREELSAPGGPLRKERFSGVVDAVGDTTLVSALAQATYGSAVAACGLAGGAMMPGASVMPHILRGVALLGIDSVMAPAAKRDRAWARLARDLDIATLASMTAHAPMSDLPRLALDILAGQIRGRVVIDIA